jgi:hypothetical protein
MRFIGYGILSVLLGGVVLAIAIAYPFYFPVCTTRIVETQRALQASNRELGSLDLNNRQGLCQAYRQRVAVLRQAVPVFTACRAATPVPTGTAPPMHVELSFYENLVAQKCDEI